MAVVDLPDLALASIEEAIVTIVREATLPSLQERFVAHAGVNVERAGYGVLRVVAEQGALRLSDLATHLGLDTSTVSRHVKVLERQGLLVRTGDPRDGRAALLDMTPDGRDALDRLRTARHGLFAEILAEWSPADRDVLAPLLERLAHDFLVQGGRL